jgi:hypothetical protein
MGTFLTKGTQFITGDTVTASGLNNLVDNSTVTAGSIGSTELGTDSVTNGKIIATATGSEPVTTGTIRDNAISNDKLAGMTRGTVKVGDASGDASDLDVKTDNNFLSGDGTDIKSKTFDSATAGDITITSTADNFYLEIGLLKIVNGMVLNEAINTPKLSPSTSGNPGVIIYGASGTPAELTTTSSSAVLTSAGTGAPSWKTHNKTVSMGTFPAVNKYVIAQHGMGAAPVTLDFYIQCNTIGDGEYEVGDRIFIKASYFGTNDVGMNFGANGTYVWLTRNNTVSLNWFFDRPYAKGPPVVPPSSDPEVGVAPGLIAPITVAKWDLYAVVGT